MLIIEETDFAKQHATGSNTVVLAREYDDNSSCGHNHPNYQHTAGLQSQNRENKGGTNRDRGGGSRGGGNSNRGGYYGGGRDSWQQHPNQRQQWRCWMGSGQQWQWPLMP